MARMRLRRSVAGFGGLTWEQRMELMYDCVAFNAFAGRQDYERAWWTHRAELLGQCLSLSGPFSRPAAYWNLEGGGFLPNCEASGRESEAAALIRLGLPLTSIEKRIVMARGVT